MLLKYGQWLQAFDQAAKDVKDKLTSRPTNDELLEIYALFKQATVGDNNTCTNDEHLLLVTWLDYISVYLNLKCAVRWLDNRSSLVSLSCLHSFCPVCMRALHSASRNALDGPEGEGQMGRVDRQERCAYVVYSALDVSCTCSLAVGLMISDQRSQQYSVLRVGRCTCYATHRHSSDRAYAVCVHCTVYSVHVDAGTSSEEAMTRYVALVKELVAKYSGSS